MEQLYKVSTKTFEEVEEEYAGILKRIKQDNPDKSVTLIELRKLANKISEAGCQVYVLEHRAKLRLMFGFIHNKILFAGANYKDVPNQVKEMQMPGRLTSLSEL